MKVCLHRVYNSQPPGHTQRTATKILPEIKNNSYTERLRSLGLPLFEYIRLRSDVIQAFKIHKNIDRLDEIKLFPKPMNPSRLTTRGHAFKFYKPQCRTNIRKFSFAHQVVENWNKLPADIENCHSVTCKKKKYALV